MGDRLEQAAEGRLGAEHRIGEATRDDHPSPRTSVKNSTRVAAALRAVAALALGLGRGQRLDDLLKQRAAPGRCLQQRIEARDQLRFALVAPGDVAMADVAVGALHRAARDRDLAEIEALAGAAGAAACHDQSGLRLAQQRERRLSGLGPAGLELVRRRPGEDREPALALLLLVVLLVHPASRH